jgi:triosephosphate isomerase
MANKLIVGNWKMYVQTPEEAKKLSRKLKLKSALLKKTSAVICPPFPFIGMCAPKRTVKNFTLGAQNSSSFKEGSHTGEVGAEMLKTLGAEFVIVGHSERRELDTDEDISKKVNAVLEAGLKPILCVGEKTRDENATHYDFIEKQIKAGLAAVPKNRNHDIVVAYEPVWAIGGKEAMHPEQIQEMNLFVKKVFADIFGSSSGLKLRVLYGGSVNCNNAAQIIEIGQVDGLLVGRESANATGFIELLKAVDNIK